MVSKRATGVDMSKAETILGQLTKEPIDYFRSFYADTALSGSAIGTRCGLEFFGAEHVLFASDCPFDPEGGPMYIREMIRVIDQLDITDEERQLIYEGNIRRIASLDVRDRSQAGLNQGATRVA
jgi:predicted TIM-barrel fold metal-dependent hydrolase